jgi:hypothetical protein
MDNLLLVLILASGPNHEELETHISESLEAASGDKVHVVVGADAVKELDGRGVKDIDLVASPAIGDQLTAADGHLIIIRCERSVAGGDAMIESSVWAHGHDNRHVAIAGGKDADPTNGAISGILGLTAPWLPDRKGNGNPDLDAKFAHLADVKDWNGMLDATATVAEPKDARTWYYNVLALVNLGRKADAEAAFAKMKDAYPTHILTATAGALVAPPPAVADGLVDDGSNHLNDGTAGGPPEELGPGKGGTAAGAATAPATTASGASVAAPTK